MPNEEQLRTYLGGYLRGRYSHLLEPTVSRVIQQAGDCEPYDLYRIAGREMVAAVRSHRQIGQPQPVELVP